MDTRKPTDTAATVIIGQKVRAGSEQAFEAWQQEMNSEASQYPGFIAAEINPPTAVQRDWVVVYRFDSIANVQAWINSATRQERLAAGAAVLRRPGHPAGRRWRCPPSDDPLVTVVVTHRVKPENVDGVPGLAGTTSAGGEQVSRVPRHRTVSPRRGHPGRVDRAVPLRHRRRSRQVADIGRTQGTSRRGREVLRLPPADRRQLIRQLVRLRRARQPGAATVGDQDVHRGVGGPVPDRGDADPSAVPAEDAALARHAHRKPVVELRHELRRRCRTT